MAMAILYFFPCIFWKPSPPLLFGLIEMLGFGKGENLFIPILIKPMHYNWPWDSIMKRLMSVVLRTT